MKKIALVSNTSWSIYNFRFGIMKALRDAGHIVVAIAPYDKYSEIIEKEGFEYRDVYIDNRGTNPINDIKTIIDLYTILRDIRPNIILSFTIKPNIYGNIAASLLNIKTINNISGLGTVFIRESIVTKIVKFLYKYALTKSLKVFFQNKEDMNLFVEKNLICATKCDLLPGSGIDILKFVPVNYQHHDNLFRFIMIARMLWDKGVGEYVEAARMIKAKYQHVKFYLLGFLEVDNPSAISKEQMDAWVDEGVVEYLGVSDKVYEEIAKVDCVVLPSYREGTPRALLEAASMAKPIITTDAPGCRDVVNDCVNGYLCKVKDAKDLADKMEKMINLSVNERRAMGKAGREKMIREFDEKIVINKYLETINNVLKTQ
ncbi:MAG: glycosyltransferase family 4 protein [Caldisericum exile]|uniref:glycosyltransferase family 4 protein n=1 Tax=Caldisericum exile TaxID=693075 RepID=UPI003C74EE39